MNFNVEFDSNYKGKRIDLIIGKFSAFVFSVAFAIFVIIIGLYTAFYTYFRIVIPLVRVIGIIVILIGEIILIAAPFIGVFKGYNRGLRGKINLSAEKRADGEWYYSVSSFKKGKPFSESGVLSLINLKKRVAEFSTTNGKEYYVPYSVLTPQQKTDLFEMEKALRAKRIADTKTASEQKRKN